jgi:putative transposase
MRFEFIDAEKARFPVLVLCDVLEVSPSGYYARRQRPPSTHAIADAQLAVHVVAAHHVGQKAYGSPRVLRELRAQGMRVARKRVARLMREQGIRVRQKRRYRVTTESNHELPVAPNLLARNFDVVAPNRAWVGDVTCIDTFDGWLYLAVIIDLP